MSFPNSKIVLKLRDFEWQMLELWERCIGIMARRIKFKLIPFVFG